MKTPSIRRSLFTLATTLTFATTAFGMNKGELVQSLEDDFTKFYEKGNKAAGTRVRKGMQDLKNFAQDIRTEVQKAKNKG